MTTAVAHRRTDTTAVLTASGIEKSYQRGMWPLRRSHRVFAGCEPGVVPG